jgi:hypothetical protein
MPPHCFPTSPCTALQDPAADTEGHLVAQFEIPTMGPSFLLFGDLSQETDVGITELLSFGRLHSSGAKFTIPGCLENLQTGL